MDGFPLTYQAPLFRPPSESHSLIFQVTLGCSWNRCAFCEMYPEKKFTIKPEPRVREEITRAAEVFPQARRIFLADGNALVLSHRRLANILDLINGSFPAVTRVSAYALPRDILSKTPEQLADLREKGLKLIYVGIESGDRKVLKMVNKGETPESTVAGLRKARESGLKTSVMILTGLGGKEFLKPHALGSAEVVNLSRPDYLSTLVLMFPRGIRHFQGRFSGSYIPLDIEDVLEEMRLFISHIELEKTVFRSDHASNYLTLKGILNRDKERFLQQLDAAIRSPLEADLKPEWLRGL